MPPQASTLAPEHDAIFLVLTALTLLFTLIVCVTAVFFVIKYREGTKADRSSPVYENPKLEMVLTVVPTILGLIMFFFGAKLYIAQRTPPKDAEEIFVIGKQWMWHVQHSNGVRENNTLHVPMGRPVKLTMISQDVIHAFYIPAFRTQMYVVPGRYTQIWFNATKTGNYHLFCNLYCGTQHSEMGGTVVVQTETEYRNWLNNGGQNAAPVSMAQAGEKLFNKIGCNNCHGATDSPRAPSLAGIYMSKRKMSDGTVQNADEAYLRESVLRPWNKITMGYGKEMPAYESTLTEEEVLSLIAYMKNPGATKGSSVSSGTSREEGLAAKTDTKNGLAVNAIEAQTTDPAATPTKRRGSLSVGAMAAQKQTEGQK